MHPLIQRAARARVALSRGVARAPGRGELWSRSSAGASGRGAWRGLALTLALLGLVACRAPRRADPDAGTGEFARGDHVVVEVRAGAFLEGRVVHARAGEVGVQPLAGGETLVFSGGEVYRLPPSAGALSPEALVICSPKSATWLPCRVVSAPAAGLVEVEDVDGARHRVLRAQVLEAGELTALNLKRRFAEARRVRGFREAADRAGTPVRPASWKPGPRDRVIARRAEGWLEGVVHEIEKKRLHIRFLGDERIVEVPLAEVVPVMNEPVLAGCQFVLVRPSSPAAAWEVWRLKGPADERGVTLEGARGERQVRPLRDVVPLVP